MQAPFDGCAPACAQCRSQYGSSCGSICLSRCSDECNQPAIQPLGGHVAVGATFPGGEEHRPIEIEHLFLDPSTVQAVGAFNHSDVLTHASFTQYPDSGCRNRDDICDASRKPCSNAASRLAWSERDSAASRAAAAAWRRATWSRASSTAASRVARAAAASAAASCLAWAVVARAALAADLAAASDLLKNGP